MATYHQPRYSLRGLIEALENPRKACYERDLVGEASSARGEGLALQFPDRPGNTLSLPTRDLVRALRRDLTIGAASGGGDLAFATATQVAAAARPQLVLDRAGVQRLELLDQVAEISFPTWDAEQSPGGWIGEGADGDEVDLTTRSVTAAPRSSYGFIELTRRLRQNLDQAETLILAELGRAVASVVETGLLQGSGSESQPLGLVNLPGRQVVNWGGALPTYAEVNNSMAAYLSAHGNYDRSVWIAPSALAIFLLEIEKATNTGQFIATATPPSGLSILGRPLLVSDYMPSGTLLLFDPTTVRTVYWGAPYALLDRFSDGRDLRGDSMLLVYNNVDIVSLYPNQVVVGS